MEYCLYNRSGIVERGFTSRADAADARRQTYPHDGLKIGEALLCAHSRSSMDSDTMTREDLERVWMDS